MASSLGTTMTPNPNTPGKRPRVMLPIIPAIPRSLERKPKPETSLQKVEEVADIPLATESTDDMQEETPATSEQDVHNEDLCTSNTDETSRGSLEKPNEEETEKGNNPSPSISQNFGIEKHGFKLPPPFYPKKSPPAAILVDYPTTNGQPDIVQGRLRTPLDNDDDKMPQQDLKLNHHPLRATALSFHAHPTPPGDLIALPSASLPSASSHQRLGLDQSISFPPQTTSPIDTTSPPTQFPYQRHVHTHNISFYPPPPLSSNDPSSPARSVYQGYAYGPPPPAYSPQSHAVSQQPKFFQPHAEAYVSPEQQYASQSPYYNTKNPPFSSLGSQAPLTPSATPLDTVPQQWNSPNEYQPDRSQHGLPPNSRLPGFWQRYRSTSPSTLKSENSSSQNANLADGNLQPIRDERNDLPNLRMAELDGMPNTRLNGSFVESPVVEHLLRHFNDGEYADCRLLLTHDNERFGKTEWSLSSLLLVQSPKLRDLLKASKQDEFGKRLIELRLTDRFVTTSSIESVLRVLYGMLPSMFIASSLSEDFDDTDVELSARRMAEALAYTASGCLLHLKDVVLRGLQVASEILNWDSLEAALCFGLECGRERVWNASASVIPAWSTLLARDSDPSPSSHVLFTPSSSSDPAAHRSSLLSNSASSPESYHQPPPQSAYDLLQRCLNFIVSNFPASWELDISVRPLADVDRLPVTAESRSPLCKSRLSRIQFGDHPSEATAKSADHNVLISTILLSIPTLWLKSLLIAEGEPIQRSIDSIVRERERRRHIVLQSKSVSWSERMAAREYAWAAVGIEESVKTGNDGKKYISTRYSGIARDPMEDGVADQRPQEP